MARHPAPYDLRRPGIFNRSGAQTIEAENGFVVGIVNRKEGFRTAQLVALASVAPDVVHIRYDIARDWSGDWAIFFRVLLSDEASKTRLREVAAQVAWRLEERFDLPSMGLFPYYNFRSVSEQEALREEAWA